MARLPDPTQTLDARGRAIYHKLAGARSGLGVLYLDLLNHPVLAEHIGQLGTYLRFHGLLPGDVRELAILATARALDDRYVWEEHVGHAIDAGVPKDVIDLVARNERAHPAMSALHADVCEAARLAAAQKELPAKMQGRLERSLGLKGMVELVALCAFYRCISTIVAAFAVPLPDRGPPPF